MKLDLITIIQRTPGELLKILPTQLTEAGYTEIVLCQDYIYAKGNIPILLQAHIDTVHHTCYGVFETTNKNVLWAPSGIGGDDRCGVFAILAILKFTTRRPSILFTNFEESGGKGANSFLRYMPSLPGINFILAFDRQGEDEAVFYDCGNKEFQKMIESFGFIKKTGTFSDISILAPAWNIAAVNLGVGYYEQHTKNEYIVVSQLRSTINKATKIIDTDNPEVYDFQEVKWGGNYYRNGAWDSWGEGGKYVQGKWTEDAGTNNDFNYVYNVTTGKNERHYFPIQKKETPTSKEEKIPTPLLKKPVPSREYTGGKFYSLGGLSYWDCGGERLVWDTEQRKYIFVCSIDQFSKTPSELKEEEYQRLFGERTLLPSGEIQTEERDEQIAKEEEKAYAELKGQLREELRDREEDIFED